MQSSAHGVQRRISLARGIPASEIIPLETIRAAGVAALAAATGQSLAYGPPAGHLPLREWVAARHSVDPARVLLTNGSLQALDLVLGALAARTIITEEPCYDYALLTIARHAANPVGVPLDDHDAELPALARALARSPAGRTVIYTIPTHQNPSGVTASVARRRRLLDLAARREAWIIEDDPYRGLSFIGSEPPTLLSLDDGDRVIHLTSFTKTVAPALRCGAAIVPAGLASGVERRARELYIAPGGYAAATVAAYCRAGSFESGLPVIRAALARRCDALATALRVEFGDRARFRVPAGGYFLWVSVSGADADELAAVAHEMGVDVVPGGRFYLDSNSRTRLRLAFSSVDERAAVEAAARLGRALSRLEAPP